MRASMVVGLLLWALLVLVASREAGAGSSTIGDTRETYEVGFSYAAGDGTGALGTFRESCRSGVAYLVEGSTGQAKLHSVGDQGEAIGSGTELLTLTTPGLAGAQVFTDNPGAWLTSEVTVSGGGQIRVACANFLASGEVVAPTALASVTARFPGTAPAILDLVGSGSSCSGGCTYAWTETTALCSGIDAASQRNTFATGCAAGAPTFQLVVTNPIGSDNDSDSDTVGAAASGFPFTFPVLLQ